MPHKVKDEGLSTAHPKSSSLDSTIVDRVLELYREAQPKSSSIDSRPDRVARVIFLYLPSVSEIYHARDGARLGGGRI